MIVMLRAAGTTLDLEACKAWIPTERLDACWRVGELRSGKPAPMAGFNLLLSDSEDTAEAIASAHSVLTSLTPHVKKLVEGGVGVSVDLGVEVYSIVPATLTLPPAFIARVVEIGADLVVSAYPCSDEDG